MTRNTINSNNGNIYYIDVLTKEFCQEHSTEILNIINIIPYIKWTEEDLFLDNDYFKNKWQYSLVVTNSQKEIVGILIAYFRLADDKHIIDSLYIHKLVIKTEYQKNGIGTELINCFIKKSYTAIDWLWNISVQTNDEITNKYVIDFYDKMGFAKYYNVEYFNKNDVLMVYERDCSFYSVGQKGLKHPRLNTNEMPVFHFASTNEQKKSIVKFIFNNYNIKVNFTNPIKSITEPQVESPDVIEEQILVSFPLKYISRFIDKAPYVIEDTMLFIEFFNRSHLDWELPGHDTKRWWKQLGANGIIDILGKTKKRKAKYVSQIGTYVKSNEYYFGRGETMGSISYEIANQEQNQSKGTYPSFFHLIFIPDGANKTLAEMSMYEFSKYDYIRKSIFDFIQEIKNKNIKYTNDTQLTLF